MPRRLRSRHPSKSAPLRTKASAVRRGAGEPVETGRIVNVRRRPVRIGPDNALYAVEIGYYPPSATGFRSGSLIGTTGRFARWTVAAIEEVAAERDKTIRAKLRRVAVALKEPDRGEALQRLSLFLAWFSAATAAEQEAFFAREADARSLLEGAARLWRKMAGMAPIAEPVAAWTPAHMVREQKTALRHANAAEAALGGDWGPLVRLIPWAPELYRNHTARARR